MPISDMNIRYRQLSLSLSLSLALSGAGFGAFSPALADGASWLGLAVHGEMGFQQRRS